MHLLFHCSCKLKQQCGKLIANPHVIVQFCSVGQLVIQLCAREFVSLYLTVTEP